MEQRVGMARSNAAITIAGRIGSGKSEVARELARLTGRSVLSTGFIFRQIAARYGMSVTDLNEFAKTHPEIDKEVDDNLRQLSEQPEPLIVDSRMGWYFIASSFKVYLDVDPLVAARRVHGADRADESYASLWEAASEIRRRGRAEAERYRDVYGADREDWRNYDLVIDTTSARAADVALRIQERFQDPAMLRPDCWLTPTRLIPTQDIRELADERVEELAIEIREHGYDNACPVDIVVTEDWYFIVDGHARVSAAIQRGEQLIRCRLVACGNEEVLPGLEATQFARTSTWLSRMYDWEAAHAFTFASYPDWMMRRSR